MQASFKSWLALPFTAALLSFGMQAPAQAQVVTGGLVNVQLVDVNVIRNVANNLHINIGNVPITVIAPISVAANVCDISVNVLTALTTPNNRATCTATSSSAALLRIVQNAIQGP